MKKYWLFYVFAMIVATLSFTACGDDDNDDEIGGNQSEEQNSGNQGNESGTSANMIFETSLFSTYDLSKNNDKSTMGWYQFNIDYRVGATIGAFRNGVSAMRVTVWSSNATYGSFKTSDYGKKHSETFYLTSSDLTFRDRFPMLSKEQSITMDYEVEYSQNNSWHSFRKGSVSFSM